MPLVGIAFKVGVIGNATFASKSELTVYYYSISKRHRKASSETFEAFPWHARSVPRSEVSLSSSWGRLNKRKLEEELCRLALVIGCPGQYAQLYCRLATTRRCLWTVNNRNNLAGTQDDRLASGVKFVCNRSLRREAICNCYCFRCHFAFLC